MTENNQKKDDSVEKCRSATELARQTVDKQEFIEGAKIFSRFVKRPEHFKNAETVLRVRMDGKYGGWRLRDAVFEGFGFVPGDTLYLNDVFVLGIEKIDVDLDTWSVDCFAADAAADWLEEGSITTGSVFEGKFRLSYETVEKGAGSSGGREAIDAKIAKLILLEGIRVIADATTYRKKIVDAGMGEMLSSIQKALLNVGSDSDE